MTAATWNAVRSSTNRMSAIFPGLTEPSSSSTFKHSAALSVAICTATTGGMPLWMARRTALSMCPSSAICNGEIRSAQKQKRRGSMPYSLTARATAETLKHPEPSRMEM